jgi:hypothetical protein
MSRRSVLTVANNLPQRPPNGLTFLAIACRYEVVDRLVQGMSGLFLALRRRPVIRYQRNSEYARRLAESLYSLTYKQQVCRAARRGDATQRARLQALVQYVRMS